MVNKYGSAVTISELGSSDHIMVLIRPIDNRSTRDNGHVLRVQQRSKGRKKIGNFGNALSLIRWEPLYRLTSCEDMYIITHYKYHTHEHYVFRQKQ